MDTLSIGKHNPRLADIRRAVQHGRLTRDGLLPIEGPKLVHEAHASGVEIAALFLREGIPIDGLPEVSMLYRVEPATFKAIQSTEHSQGVIALVRPRTWSLEDVLARSLTRPSAPLSRRERASPAPITVLAGLQDPGNVGTILRIAECFRAAGCLGLVGTASIHNSKLVRASAGSVFRIPCIWDLELNTILDTLTSQKIPLVGTSPHAMESITGWDWTRPVAVLIGNEGAGLSPSEAARCAAVLRIPQEPQVESLNSAIAAAVVLYESYRRRNHS